MPGFDDSNGSVFFEAPNKGGEGTESNPLKLLVVLLVLLENQQEKGS